MDFKKIFKELKRRNVAKSALAYLAVAWIFLQVFSLLSPIINAPQWFLKTLTIILFIGFPCWLLFSWKYQISSDGLKKIENIDSIISRKAALVYTLFFIIIISPVAILLIRPVNNSVPVETKVKNASLEESENKNEELSSNLIALDFYFKGRFHLQKQSLNDINLAIENYLNAIKHDSLFTMAYNELSSAYMRKNLSFDPNTKWEEEAYAAAGKALRLNPKLANPHIIQGQFFWSPSHNFAHKEAINEFKKSIIKDSTISQSYEQLSLVQLHIGLFEKAHENAQKSISLDPSNYRAKRFIGEIFLFQGNYVNALDEFNKIPASFEPEPTQAFKALTFFYLENQEEAIKILNENLINFPSSPHLNSVYAIILSSKGDKKEALKKMEIAIGNIDDFIHSHHIYYYLGVASALLDEKQKANDWLEKAANSGFPNYPLYNSDPKLSNLKQNQNFNMLLLKLKEDWEDFKSI